MKRTTCNENTWNPLKANTCLIPKHQNIPELRYTKNNNIMRLLGLHQGINLPAATPTGQTNPTVSRNEYHQTLPTSALGEPSSHQPATPAYTTTAINRPTTIPNPKNPRAPTFRTAPPSNPTGEGPALLFIIPVSAPSAPVAVAVAILPSPVPVPVTTEPSAALPFPFPEPAGYGGSIIAWTTGRTGAFEGDDEEEEEALGALAAGAEAAGLPEVEEGNQFVGVEAKENDVDDCERAEEDGLEEEVVGEELPFMVNWGE